MPHPDNADLFVGRKKALVQAIHGLGGVGKTHLAIRYVYEHAADYDAVLWVTADPPSKLVTDYADLARPLGLPEATRTTDVNEHIAAVRRWLESAASGRWLLVFDNAESPEALRDYLLTRHAGHVLVTTRRSRWEQAARAIEVQTMERRESVRLLLERSGQVDAAAASELAEALGDLPLALAQAAGYLADSGLSIASYLELFRQRRAELLQRGDPPDGSRLTVFATFDLALRRIDRPDVEDLVGLLACLAPDEIPRSLLEAGLGDTLRLADGLAVLGRLSLLQAGPQFVEVHRLVQAVAWDRMPAEAQTRQAERAVRRLSALFPTEIHDVRTWDAGKALQPHADQVAQLAEQCEVAPEVVGNLLDSVGILDRYRARYADAEARFRRALAIKEVVYGHDHPEVAHTLTMLSIVVRLQGDLPGARVLLERALRMIEAAPGPDNPELARALGNLGDVARREGNLFEARALLERALHIQETACGHDHPDVAVTLGNLGIVTQLQGDLSGARTLHERALQIKEARFGSDHFEVARTLVNLGILAGKQEDVRGARALQERALRILEAAYGPEHPDVALALGNLGLALLRLGEPGKAAPIAERALDVFRRSLGDKHPSTTWARRVVRRIKAAATRQRRQGGV
jgi:tetratricopeptide (TPR) repeat protein